jgi:putative FmdB family regulatory protein
MSVRFSEMPMYEYKCESCGNQFELRQKFSDPPASECPQCGGQVTKLISSAAFALKGGGWYNEGYGSAAKSAPPSCPAASGGGCAGCPSAAN